MYNWGYYKFTPQKKKKKKGNIAYKALHKYFL